MVKLTQLILQIGDEMNVEQKRYDYGQANIWVLLGAKKNFDNNTICFLKFNSNCTERNDIKNEN